MVIEKKKTLPRCPKCGSSSLYKRSRAFLWTEKSKGYYLAAAKKNFKEDFEKKSKKYRCRKCKLDFDNPVIS